MEVHFISSRTFKAHCITYPLRVCKIKLEDFGINIKFHYRVKSALKYGDVLCICSEALREFQKNNIYNFLMTARSYFDTIIWFDMSAGTGTTQFSILPYVDLYAKNQLLKDRSLYKRTFYSDRIYSDNYHRTKGIIDQDQTKPRKSIHPDQIYKLAISWNLGLGDFHASVPWRRHLRVLFSLCNYRYQATSSNKSRDFDVAYRISDNYKLATVAYQRQETRSQLANLAANGNYEIVYEGKVPYKEYHREIHNSAISPL